VIEHYTVLEIRPPKTTGVTIEYTEKNCHGKIYFFRSMHRYMGTASMRSRQSFLFLFLMLWGCAPLPRLVKVRFTICW
jgi:hypothetical protein